MPFVRGSFFAGETLHRPGRRPAPGRAVVSDPGRACASTARRLPAGRAVRPGGGPSPAARPDRRLRPPIYATAKVHRDHHIEVAKALYSIPGNLIGQPGRGPRRPAAGARCSIRGQLVKVHPRQAPGGRSTDPEDLPAEKTVYAMRDLDHLVRMAAEHGDGHRRLRRGAAGQPAAVDQDAPGLRPAGPGQEVGARAGRGRLRPRREAEAFNVGLIGRMLERATEGRIESAHPGPADSLRRPASPEPPAELRPVETTPGRPVSAEGRCRHEHPGTDHLRRAEDAAASGEAGPAASTPCPSASPWPRPADWATPSSWSWSSPTRSPARETTSAALRARAAGLDPDMCLENWDPTTKVSFDRAGLGRAVLAALRRRRPQRLDPRPRRGRQDLHGHRLRPRRRAPALQRHLRPAPTSCSKGCGPPGSTTATTPRCAN